MPGTVMQKSDHVQGWIRTAVIVGSIVITLGITVVKTRDHDIEIDALQTSEGQAKIERMMQLKTLEHTQEGMKAAAGILEQLEDRITEAETDQAVHEAEFKATSSEALRRIKAVEDRVNSR